MRTHPIVLFDGVCNLCNGAVQFIIERDKHQQFRFASLQSGFGQQYQQQVGEVDSILLVDHGKIYQKSSAALRIARKLDGLWPMLFILIIIPPFIRDFVYDIIARNRYRLFGKKESCWLPTPDLKALFLD